MLAPTGHHLIPTALGEKPEDDVEERVSPRGAFQGLLTPVRVVETVALLEGRGRGGGLPKCRVQAIRQATRGGQTWDDVVHRPLESIDLRGSLGCEPSNAFSAGGYDGIKDFAPTVLLLLFPR